MFTRATARRLWRWANDNHESLAIVTLLIAGLLVLLVETKGDAVKAALLIGLAILWKIYPQIAEMTAGKDGVTFKLREQMKELKEENKTLTNEAADEIKALIQQLFLQINAGSATESRLAQTPSAIDIAGLASKLPRPTVRNDPQAGRFGGQSEANGRRLTFDWTPSARNDLVLKIELSVEAVGSAPPLTGEVAFFLHDTFVPDYYVVPAIKGRATLTLHAIGAFTVGAVADHGETKLELDLSAPELGAPRDWRSR